MYKNHTITIHNKPYTCKASGILPYTIINNEIYFLLQQIDKTNLYSDFGGKREKTDNSIKYTAAREFSEETNGYFFSNISNTLSDTDLIKKSRIIIESLLIYNNPLYIYNFNGKYLIYLLYIKSIDPNKLDNVEKYSNIKRKCKWIKRSSLINDDFIKKKIDYRLRNKLKKNINILYKQLYKSNYIY